MKTKTKIICNKINLLDTFPEYTTKIINRKNYPVYLNSFVPLLCLSRSNSLFILLKNSKLSMETSFDKNFDQETKSRGWMVIRRNKENKENPIPYQNLLVLIKRVDTNHRGNCEKDTLLERSPTKSRSCTQNFRFDVQQCFFYIFFIRFFL